jgi:hypothetical protein
MALVVALAAGCTTRRTERAGAQHHPSPTTRATSAEQLRAAVVSEPASARRPETPPSFRRDILPVLARHCAAARGCHGDEPTESVALDLRAGSAYGELVNHVSTVRREMMLVAPGDPATSFLVYKITGALGAHDGKPMPLDPDTGAPLDPNPLAGDFVDRILRPWIVAGAPDD